MSQIHTGYRSAQQALDARAKPKGSITQKPVDVKRILGKRG